MENHVFLELVSKLLKHITSSIMLEYRIHYCWVDAKFKGSNEVVLW